MGARTVATRAASPSEEAHGRRTPGKAGRTDRELADTLACSGSRPSTQVGLWAGVAHTQPGAVSGWHHHGEYESTIYVLTGSMRMEFGPTAGTVSTPYPELHLHRAARDPPGRQPSGEPGSAVVVRPVTASRVFNVDGPGAG
jgi:uncharacterized RmlC-like cupin family protein